MLIAPDAAGPEDLFTDPDYDERQQRFRARLRNAGLVMVSVSNPARLELALLHALEKLPLPAEQLRPPATQPAPAASTTPWAWVAGGAVAAGVTLATAVWAATRGRLLSKVKAAANRAKSRIRARVEHVFGAQESAPGGRIVRTIGIVRARLTVGRQIFVYNVHRLAMLERMAAA